MNRCRTCRFYDVLAEEPGTGFCRRHPPVPALEPAPRASLDSGSIVTAWPLVDEEDWCGEQVNRAWPVEPEARR